ncbi:3-oxoacyl-[acyl-carrier-protein] reductase 4 [Quillaja saponaria]|uniref:3-oxoacyl-[acyl-carrier-protein] reductase 4 n=1 Tax=Quillaja saponaria TaxID=32244 RepID=A0AAD7LGD8_QUISA|nr:3-oxoacyl-[acyl-carrier-protein] reductase 4 [Quillaja saponaria]
MASLAGSNCVAFKSAGFSGISNRKVGQFQQCSQVSGIESGQLRPCFGLQCRSKSSFGSSGIRAQVATLEQVRNWSNPSCGSSCCDRYRSF